MEPNCILAHGIVDQPGNRMRASSTALGWQSLAASLQREQPFDEHFDAVNDHLLVFHLSGPVQVTAGVDSMVSRTMPPGAMCLWPGGAGFRVCLESELESLHLYIRRTIVDEAFQEMHGQAASGIELIPKVGGIDSMLEQLGSEISRNLLSPDYGAALYVDHVARLIAFKLVRDYSALSERKSPMRVKGLSQRQRDRIDDYIETYMDTKIDIEGMCGVACMSTTHFIRRFRLSTGLSPYQYVLQKRVNRGKRFLASTDYPIAQISPECGFSSQEHFTRIFKRWTSETPAAFRRRMSN